MRTRRVAAPAPGAGSPPAPAASPPPARRVRRVRAPAAAKGGAELVAEADTQAIVEGVAALRRTGADLGELTGDALAGGDHVAQVAEGEVQRKDFAGYESGFEEVRGLGGNFAWNPERLYYNGWTEGGDVVLVYKDGSGQRGQERVKFDWYFYMPRADYQRLPAPLLQKAKDLGWLLRVEPDEVAPDRFVKVYCPNDYTAGRDVAMEWHDVYYQNHRNYQEHSLRARHRLIMDIGRFSLQEVRAGRPPVRVLEADLTPKKRFLTDVDIRTLPRFNELYLDIETDDREHGFAKMHYKRILSVAWLSSADAYLSEERDAAGRRPLRIHFARAETNTDAGEAALLAEFAAVLRAHDLFIAWNAWGFDHPVVRSRLRYHAARWDRARVAELDESGRAWRQKPYAKRYFRALEAALPGEVHRRRKADVEGGSYVPCLPTLPGNPYHVDWRWIILADLLPVFKRYHMRGGADVTSYALDNIGRAVLKMPKLDWRAEYRARHPDRPPIVHIVDLHAEDPELLEKYNRRDVEILYRLEEFTGYLKLEQTFSRIGNCFPNDYHISTKIDGLLLKKGKREGHHWPTIFVDANEEARKMGNYEGGHVFEPVRGLHPVPAARAAGRRVCAFDFKSLYPSMISTFNLSPDVFVPPAERARVGGRVIGETLPTLTKDGTPGRTFPVYEHLITCPQTGQTFRRDLQGFVPQMFKETLFKRKKYTDLQKGVPVGSDQFLMYYRLAYAFKRLGLSFYGDMGNPSSRYFNTPVAESITLSGQWFIRHTAAFAEREFGYRILYGDTDSIYIEMDPERGPEFVRAVHAWYEREIFPRFNVRPEWNIVELEYEDVYQSILFVSKKRYIGYMVGWKGAAHVAHVEKKGLELVRSDGLQLQRVLQLEVAQLILGLEGEEGNPENPLRERAPAEPAEVLEHLLAWRRAVHSHAVDPAHLAFTKGIGKGLDEYKGNSAETVHVKLAREIYDAGQEEFYVGMKVAYVIVGTHPKLAAVRLEEYAASGKTYDAQYYWNRAVYPAAYRLLRAWRPDVDWEALDSYVMDSRKRRARQYRAWTEKPRVLAQVAARQVRPRSAAVEEESTPEQARRYAAALGALPLEPDPARRAGVFVYRRPRWAQLRDAILYRAAEHPDGEDLLGSEERSALANALLRAAAAAAERCPYTPADLAALAALAERPPDPVAAAAYRDALAAGIYCPADPGATAGPAPAPEEAPCPTPPPRRVRRLPSPAGAPPPATPGAPRT